MSPMTPTSDHDLLELVRSADPLDGNAPSQPDAASEALLRAILDTPRAEPRPRRRSRRGRAVRIGLVAAGAAAVFAAVTALPGDDHGAVTPASAAVLRHAMAALDQPPNTILHVDMVGTQDNGDGTTITWRDQSWESNAAPFGRRQVETTPQGTITESASTQDSSQVYDPATNTIYSAASTADPAKGAAHPGLRLSPGPRPGTFILRLTVYRVTPDHRVTVSHGGHGATLIVTAAQVRALRNNTATIALRRMGAHGPLRLGVVPLPANASQQSDDVDPGSPEFSSQIQALLRSGGAHLAGHATVDGRDTLEIRSADGHTTYYVDPGTYAPVRLDTTGTDGGTSLRFDTYEALPGDDANEALVSLAAQHPSATVDRDPADYRAAERRLFPHG